MSRFSQYLRNNKHYIVMMLVFALTAVSFAQATAVPVTIDIPVDDTITYLNQWLGVFGPIFLFIGMIPVAIALLRYVTGLFKSAFSGGN